MTTAAPNLFYRPFSARSLVDKTLTAFIVVCSLIAVVPLFAVLGLLIYRGLARFDWAAFTETPPAPGLDGGGFGNAIAGTALMVALATLASVPLGIMIGVYLAEFAGKGRLADVVRFAVKVLTGVPSILAGIFIFGVIVSVTGKYSALAGGLALAVLMLPTIVLTAEQALRQVPGDVREAAVGMGCTPTQVVWKVVLPAAVPAILTGVLLAVARSVGETAPLLFTALFSLDWPNPARQEPTASVSVLIYNFTDTTDNNQRSLAWTASLVLVAFVLIINLVSRWLAARFSPYKT